MMALYECPSCKTKNEENINYCTNCGTWLLSESFPAKKVSGKSVGDRFYICSFCDTINEPNRNACKKCMRPLFSTEYHAREIYKKRRRPGRIIGWTITGIFAALIGIGVIGSLISAPEKSLDAAVGSAPTSNAVETPKPQNSDIMVGQSRSTPAPLGTPVTAPVDQAGDGFEIAMVVTKVIRGAEALKMIEKANQFNPEPASGMEYLLAGIAYKVLKSDTPDIQFQINNFAFTLVSSGGVDYDQLMMAVTPDPQIDAKLYEGAEHQGWAVFQVKKDDPEPLIAFARSPNGSGGVWFETKESAT